MCNLRFLLYHSLSTNSNAVNDDTRIDSHYRDALRTVRHWHFDADEVVLNGAVADRVVFADVGVALWYSDMLNCTVIKRHFDTKLQSRPKRKVRKELEDECLFLDRIYKIHRIIIQLLKSC